MSSPLSSANSVNVSINNNSSSSGATSSKSSAKKGLFSGSGFFTELRNKLKFGITVEPKSTVNDLSKRSKLRSNSRSSVSPPPLLPSEHTIPKVTTPSINTNTDGDNGVILLPSSPTKSRATSVTTLDSKSPAAARLLTRHASMSSMSMLTELSSAISKKNTPQVTSPIAMSPPLLSLVQSSSVTSSSSSATTLSSPVAQIFASAINSPTPLRTTSNSEKEIRNKKIRDEIQRRKSAAEKGGFDANCEIGLLRQQQDNGRTIATNSFQSAVKIAEMKGTIVGKRPIDTPFYCLAKIYTDRGMDVEASEYFSKGAQLGGFKCKFEVAKESFKNKNIDDAVKKYTEAKITAVAHESEDDEVSEFIKSVDDDVSEFIKSVDNWYAEIKDIAKESKKESKDVAEARKFAGRFIELADKELLRLKSLTKIKLSRITGKE